MPRYLSTEEVIGLFIDETVNIYHEMGGGYGLNFYGEAGGSWQDLRDAWEGHTGGTRFATEIDLLTAFIKWFREDYKPPGKK